MKRFLRWLFLVPLVTIGLLSAVRAGLESATYVADFVTSNPTNADLVSAGDDHLRLVKAVLQATFPNASKAFYIPDAAAKTTTYSVVAADQNKILTGDATGGTFAFTLPTLAASDDGWEVFIQKIDSSANAVTVTATIEGLSNWSFPTQWDGATFIWTGTAWNVKDTRGGSVERVFNKTANATLATTEFDSVILVAPASATTITLPAASGRKGKWYNIKRTEASANAVTIDANASETIDGNLTVPVWAGQNIVVMGDGTNWFIASSGGRVGRPAPGTVQFYAGTTIPVGAHECYNQNVSRTTYADLFTAVGTLYGVGDGSTTFGLPDVRGRVVAGEDDMGGASANRLTAAEGDTLNGDTLGATGGVEMQTLTADESGVPAHTHVTTFETKDNVSQTGGGTYIVDDEAEVGTGTDTYTSAANSTASASEAHGVVQPTMIMKCIIWY